MPGPGERLLEVGCGSGILWEENLARIDPSWSLTLTDFSAGMIEATRRVLGARAEYAVADVQALPFADESFDVAIANHMLFHVPDRAQAYAELRRVLVAGGVLHASTNGRGHMRELQELVPDWEFAFHTEAFGLETGAEELAAFFDDVAVELMDDGLAVTEAEPALAYIRSSHTFSGQDLAPARAAIEAAIEREGAFRVTKRPGLITAR